MNTTSYEDSSLASEQEYDSQIAHTIWELERTLKRGRAGESTRRALIQAHASQLQLLEERYGIPEEGRSFLLLQKRVAPGILLIPGEGVGCERLGSVGRFFHRAGFTVLGSSLSYRDMSDLRHRPMYWQTGLDEAQNRYDMLSNYTSRIAVLGVGLSATLALHLARAKRVSCVIALFPIFNAKVPFGERFKLKLRRIFSRKQGPPAGWDHQRRFATDSVREHVPRMGLPLFVVAEEKRDRSEEGLSVRTAEHWLAKRTTNVRLVPEVHAGAPYQLPEAVLDELVRFIRQH